MQAKNSYPRQVPGWHVEYDTDEAHALRADWVVDTRTAYQHVQIVDTRRYGRCLFLDGVMQSAALDEPIYHECLVHPALLAHPQPSRVLILGGGEGATLREVLRHPSVRSVEMVDLDAELVDLCAQHLPSWHQGLLTGADTLGRANIVFGEGRRHLLAGANDPSNRYDVIVCDLPDPQEGGPAPLLYTREFYTLASIRLAPGGIVVTQSGPSYFIPEYDEAQAVLFRTLSAVFRIVRPYSEYVPSFHCRSSFLLASQRHDPLSISQAAVRNRMADRCLTGTLRYLSAERFHALFQLPVGLRQQFEAPGPISTDEAPWQTPTFDGGEGSR